MALVEIKNLEFGPLQVTLKSPSEELYTTVIGRRQTIVVEEDRITEDIRRKSSGRRLRVSAYKPE